MYVMFEPFSGAGADFGLDLGMIWVGVGRVVAFFFCGDFLVGCTFRCGYVTG